MRGRIRRTRRVSERPTALAAVEPATTLVNRRCGVLATSPGGIPTIIIAVGYADLTFTRTPNDRWVITRWDDHVDPDVGVNPSEAEQLTLGRRRLESRL